MGNTSDINRYRENLIGFLGRKVSVVIDRPLGSAHPKHKSLVYKVNYGYIPNVMAPDGEEQDAYVLGIDEPVESAEGKVIAIVRRINDVEDKLVVSAGGRTYSKEYIERTIDFQERYFMHILIALE